MKNHVPTFESFVNEARVYGMFNDSQGKPSKLSQEILDICMKGLPKTITDNIESVEAAGYGKTNMISPPTISNKGQSRGYNDYTSIILIFQKPIGRNKVTEMTVGLRKRTSGPGTGYIAVDLTANGHDIPGAETAVEFWSDDAQYFLEKLYNEKIKAFL
jgi:hypothetical protein